ncbi:MAG: methyltransferase domain-containing protein [Alphaproteobacteria bacterium]
MADNSDQIAEWNGALGERWAELQRYLDQMTGPFGVAALQAANLKSGEQVIDIGCGCGDTSFAIARAVGGKGAVLGLDISRPMLEVAERRKRPSGWAMFPSAKPTHRWPCCRRIRTCCFPGSA